MMKFRWLALWRIVFLFLLLGVLVAGQYKFHRSFLYATSKGDWRRMPLLFPYELGELELDSGVSLSNHQSGKGFAARHCFPKGTGGEEMSLASLDGIYLFDFKDGLLFGERDLRFMGEYFGMRYFVFDFSRGMSCHYDSEENFLATCREYGIVHLDLHSFDEWYARHEKMVSGVPFCLRILKGLAEYL